MRIVVLGTGMKLPATVKQDVETRVRSALNRFAKRVLWVAVRLEDCNGPRGGVDKRCRIKARLKRAGHVVTGYVSPHVRTAIEGARVRLKQVVSRRAKRHWQSRRRSAMLGRKTANGVTLAGAMP